MSNLEERLERYTPDLFFYDVEKMVCDKELSYMEAVLEITKDGDIEEKFISKLISPKLKEILRDEGLALNYLNKKEFGHKTFNLLDIL